VEDNRHRSIEPLGDGLQRVRLRQHDQLAIVLHRPGAAREFLRHGWARFHLYKPWMIKPNKTIATPLNISKPIRYFFALSPTSTRPRFYCVSFGTSRS
jgi:hypothetical protein